MSQLTNGVFGRVQGHLGMPLYRNGYALILSTGLTSGLGFLYWMAAARLYPTPIVGLNSAALSALVFLAGIAQLNLANVLIRFLPSAGRAASTLVDRATGITLLAGLGAGLAFLVGIDWWAPSLGFLRGSPLLIVGYVLATAIWGVFVLQEGVLTGLRLATWVPIRNVAFATSKIALLIVFAAVLPTFGILASWILPAGLSLVPVGIWIRRSALTRPAAPYPSQDASLRRSSLLRYAAADYAGSLFWLSGTMIVPVLVTEVAGPTANAHFYLAWTIAYALYLIAPSMGSSLIVESSLYPTTLLINSRRALAQTVRLVVPLASLLIVVAPYVLALLGGAYADEGTTVMRLLALSAVPNIVNALYTSIARAQQNIPAIVGILGAQCICVLVLSYPLLLWMDITGVGLAWLVSQSSVALLLLLLRKRVLPLPNGPDPELG